MSWPGSRSGNYGPLGFAPARGNGAVGGPEDAYPLLENPVIYNSTYTTRLSQPFNPEIPVGSYSSRSSVSSTLYGGDYFQSPQPESFPTGYTDRNDPSYSSSYRKPSDQPTSIPKQHKPWKQFLHLLGSGFLRFLVTAGLIIGLWQIIWTYNKFDVLNTSQKRFFNFLVTAFSLALGLNLASSLKSVATKARWWLISGKKRPLEEVESILQCHALTEVVKLGCRTMFKKPSIAFVCALWLLINLATQVFVAVLGLNWTLVSAIDSKSAIPGNVLYQNMTQFYFRQSGDTVSANQMTAHLYGDLAVNSNVNFSLSDVPGRLPVVPPLSLYSQTNQTDFWDFDTYSQHVFLDYPADGDTSIGWFYTDRSINTEASCASYPEKATLEANNTVTMGPNHSLQPNSTVYWIRHDKMCGPRCAKVFALENMGTEGFFYDCNVTVGIVTNANHPAQSLSDDLAIMAAQAIAVTGYGGSKASSTDQEFTYYNADYWGTYLAGNETSMAWLLRVHAIGVISGANWYNNNANEPVLGLIPNQGVTLNLDHPDFIALILGGIGAFHFIFFILAAWLANKVVVIHDSYLAIALLMRPMVERLESGSMMDGKELCRALNHPEVSFGAVDKHTIKGKIKHLEISEKSGKPTGGWRGWYD